MARYLHLHTYVLLFEGVSRPSILSQDMLTRFLIRTKDSF